MMFLFYIALGYLLFTSGILYLNKRDFTPLQPTPPNYFDEQAPEVDICIPARNEKDTIERCVRSAVDQFYPNYGVHVLDDGSTDGTADILDTLQKEYPDKLRILPGKPKPSGWVGKSWACHQLSKETNGKILIFIDADTWLEPEATRKVVRTMGHDIVDFITLWPKQKLGTFWERTVIPLVYFALLTLLPTRYVYRAPTWIPSFLKREMGALFSAACGQFMAFKRPAYEDVGGHSSTKGKVVEDVELAKNIKRKGYRMKMYHGRKTVSCRMYFSAEELWEGFRKNFLAGFGNNVFLFAGMGLLHLVAFILPALALPFLLFLGSPLYLVLSAGLVAIMLIQRLVVDRWFDWNPLYGLLHPLGVAWFQMLGIQVFLDYMQGRAHRWKDRDI